MKTKEQDYDISIAEGDSVDIEIKINPSNYFAGGVYDFDRKFLTIDSANPVTSLGEYNGAKRRTLTITESGINATDEITFELFINGEKQPIMKGKADNQGLEFVAYLNFKS
jgi:hypothetical protein